MGSKNHLTFYEGEGDVGHFLCSAVPFTPQSLLKRLCKMYVAIRPSAMDQVSF